MYGYIYITTNLVNGKKYIGRHKSEVFDESYKGSGLLLSRSIDKYGWDNFTCEILAWCDSNNELNKLEKYYIDLYDAVNSDEFYNIANGGQGGNTLAGYDEEQMLNFADKISLRWKDKDYNSYVSNKISESLKGKPKSETHMQHLRASRILNNTNKGKNNPMYGVHRFGKDAPTYGKHWYNNGIIQHMFTEEDYNSIYRYQGYVKGKL